MKKNRTVGKDTRKKTRKATSRYQTVRMLRETGDKLAERAREYQTRYIRETVKSGKTFVADFTDNPRKTMDSLADDGRELCEDLGKDARKKANGYLKDGRKFYRRAKKNPRRTFDSVVADGKTFVEEHGSDTKKWVDDLIQDGQEIIEGLEKDTRLVADKIMDSGKKAFKKFSGQVADGENETHLIKKYVNGRFYDTVNKKYLKKDELARLIKRRKNVRIISTKTGKNITRSVVSGLSLETQTGKRINLSVDEFMSRVKENQKRLWEAVERQVDSVRKLIDPKVA